MTDLREAAPSSLCFSEAELSTPGGGDGGREFEDRKQGSALPTPPWLYSLHWIEMGSGPWQVHREEFVCFPGSRFVLGV